MPIDESDKNSINHIYSIINYIKIATNYPILSLNNKV